MSELKVDVTDVGEDFLTSLKSLSVPVAQAATGAITLAAAALKVGSRAAISAAGFSTKWQNAYRVTVYPQKGFSIDAAAFGRFRGIDYSNIFQQGGVVRGHPMLWIALKSTPRIDRRKTHPDPKDFLARGIKLVTMNTNGPRPLLGATVLMSKASARKNIVKLSVNDLRKGTKGKSKNQRGFVRRTIPLFFGIPQVTLRKEFDLNQVAVRVASQVPSFYAQKINQLAD